MKSQSDKILLSVVFSFRNEEDVLPKLIKRLHDVLRPLDLEYELIFVNDASSDGSLELLKKEREKDKNIKIINMSRVFGVAPCIMAGFRYSKGDAVIYMDADLQDPPELIPTLLEKWREGADVVHTTRTKRKGENPLKMWVTEQAYKTINLASDIDILKNTGNFKLLSRKAISEVVRLNECDPYIRGLIQWVGFKQAQVFYERRPRVAGKPHFSLLRSSNPVKEFIRGITSFSALPLYFALIVGFFVSLGAFLFLIGIVVTKLMGMVEYLPGWPAAVVSTLFLGGTILFTIGILGVYIGNIHHDIKNRPPYIIESKIGIDND